MPSCSKKYLTNIGRRQEIVAISVVITFLIHSYGIIYYANKDIDLMSCYYATARYKKIPPEFESRFIDIYTQTTTR